MTITSPASDATVSGSVAIRTTDTCAGNWFETLYVDSRYITDGDTGAVVFNSLKVGNGNHVIRVTSQSMNPGSRVLGSAQVTLNVQNAGAAPPPGPTPSPSQTSGPSCVTITSPANGATVSRSVPIRTTDTCRGNWFETLYVDGRYVTDADTGAVVFNSLRVSDGNHVIRVTSQSMNAGSRVLGSAQLTLNVQNAVPLRATASASTSSGNAPLMVPFKAAATGGHAPFTYAWEFGDGTHGSGSRANHTYGPGAFHPRLTVRDAAGGTWSGSVGTIKSTARPTLPQTAGGGLTPATPTPTSLPTPSEPSGQPSPTPLSSTSGRDSTSGGGSAGDLRYVLLVLMTGSTLLAGLGGALFLGWRRRRLG